ncbi:hypothetical protein [Actinotalea sp. Marseille-Q4924]|uniref:hypothetical protein n=1 Tax=Actinotalea sp. Marseille-Q4924 TaxID=2866571 RepID=UPI001CE443DD|nr:hypothetical protein [Actinotalea sp. Marseille-Q4924]
MLMEPRHRAVAPPADGEPARAVARLGVLLLRRGVVALLVGLVAYVVLEVEVFEATYPTQASRDLVARLGEDPAVRMLSGVPAGTSIGALVVWDAGWLMQVVLGLWAVVATARLLRGDEEAGRTDWLLAGSAHPRRVLAAQLAALGGATVLVGAAVGLAFAAAGTDAAGATAFGSLLAGFGLTQVGLVALLSQVFGSRGRVLAVAGSALGAAFLLRMVANSANGRAWLAWFTPLGWNDRLQSFGDERWTALLVPLGAAVVLASAALALRGRRDTGAGVVRAARRERSTTAFLGGPTRFAARSAAATLAGWAVGLTAVGATVGWMLPSLERYLDEDPAYLEMLAVLGIAREDVTGGFVSMMGVITGLALCLRVAWRVGAARSEEDSGRLEQLLVRPVPRWHWLAGHVVVAVVDAVVLSAVAGAATWLGATAAGAGLDAADAFAAMANPLPVVAVFLGLAVALQGLAPRFVVGVTASVAMLLYVLELVGPPLAWPDLLVAVSPFHHLALVPVDPFGVAAALGMLGVALALGAVGFAAFARRDLVGA